MGPFPENTHEGIMVSDSGSVKRRYQIRGRRERYLKTGNPIAVTPPSNEG